MTNEFAITSFKLNLYADMDDGARIKKTLGEHKAFLVQYAKDTHQDLDEQIEKLDALIKKVKE